jgi:hypothetical protein
MYNNIVRYIFFFFKFKLRFDGYNDFVGAVIARSVFIEVGFNRMGRNELAIDC